MRSRKYVSVVDTVEINRDVRLGTCKFAHVFRNFEKVGVVKRTFGKKTAEVLGGLKVGISTKKWYMWVDDKRGRLMVGKQYLKDGDKTYLYLDVVHELVHIRQFREGRELFDEKYSYVDRPTEIEAYRSAFIEAKRLGMKIDEIERYLLVEWVNEEEFKRLCEHIGMR